MIDTQMNKNEKENVTSKYQFIYLMKLLLIALAYGINGTTFTGIPFLFFSNKLDCLNENGQVFKCPIEEACTNQYGYVQQEETQYPQIYSITMFLNIYCDRKIIEAWILTVGIFGKIVADFILVIFPLHRDRKELFINVVFASMGVILCSLQWIQDTAMFFVVFFVWNLGFTLFFGVIYTHILEVFPESISKIGAGIINMFWPCLMVLYIVYARFYGTWENTIIHFTGIPMVLIAASRFFLSSFDTSPPLVKKAQDKINSFNDIEEFNNQPENTSDNLLNNQNHTKEETGGQLKKKGNIENQYVSNLANTEVYKQNKTFIEKYFPFLTKGEKLRMNFYIWSLAWTCNYVCYIGIQYQMDTLQGDLYLNCFISNLIEAFSGFLAIIIVLKFQDKIKLFSVVTYIVTGLAFVSSTFMDNLGNTLDKVKNTPDRFNEMIIHYLVIFFQLLPIIVAKISYEMMWTVLVTYQKNTIPIPFQQSQFSCSNFISNVAANLVPFYKYFADKLGVNPFFGFGFICFITAYYSNQFEEVTYDDDGNEILQEKIENDQTCQESKSQKDQNLT